MQADSTKYSYVSRQAHEGMTPGRGWTIRFVRDAQPWPMVNSRATPRLVAVKGFVTSGKNHDDIACMSQDAHCQAAQRLGVS